jgi:hypothetical protein
MIRNCQRAAVGDADSAVTCIEYRDDIRMARRGATTHNKPHPNATMETNSPKRGIANESQFFIIIIYTLFKSQMTSRETYPWNNDLPGGYLSFGVFR